MLYSNLGKEENFFTKHIFSFKKLLRYAETFPSNVFVLNC